MNCIQELDAFISSLIKMFTGNWVIFGTTYAGALHARPSHLNVFEIHKASINLFLVIINVLI